MSFRKNFFLHLSELIGSALLKSSLHIGFKLLDILLAKRQ